MTRTVALGDVALSLQDGPFGSNLKSSHYVDHGVRVVRLQNIGVGCFDDRDRAFVSDEHFERLRRHECRAGDVLIATLGDPIIRACLQPAWLDIAINKADCLRLRCDPDCVVPEYVVHFLNSVAAQTQAEGLAHGQTRPRVNLSQVRSLRVPLAPLAEQRRIARVLDGADALRGMRTAALRQYARLGTRLFAESFGYDLSHTNGHRVAELRDVCVRITDGTHQPPKWAADGVPFLFVRNIIGGEIDWAAQKHISVETHAELTRRCPIEQGDVLYSTVGSYGVPAIVRTDRKFAFQRHIAHLKPDHAVLDPEYLSAALASDSVRRQADRAARGVAQKTLNLAEIQRFRIAIPPLQDQQEFATLVRRVAGLADRAKSQLTQFDALFASLQHNAFFGAI